MDFDSCEPKRFAKCGRREVSRQEFLREMGISEEDIRAPDEVESERTTLQHAQQAATPSTVAEMKDLGNKAFQNGNYGEAIQWFTSALEAEPDNHMLHSNRSAAYLHCNKGHDYLTLALYDADKCIELKPQWFKGYGRRGDALLAMGQLNEAIMSFERALALTPDNKSLKKSINHARKLKAAQGDELGRVVGDLDLAHEVKKDAGVVSGREYLANELSAYRKSLSHLHNSGRISIDGDAASQCTSTYNSSTSVYSHSSLADTPFRNPKLVPSDADITRPPQRAF